MNELSVQTEENSLSTTFAPGSVLDPARFSQMYRMAEILATTTLLPESLYKSGNQALDHDRIVANCFLIVDQSDRWGFSPIAVAQATSVVHGKLCYEGKLVSAVIQAKLGFVLSHHFVGEGVDKRIYLSDAPFDTTVAVFDADGNPETGPLIKYLKPGVRIPGVRLVDGSVSEWTTGEKGAWGAVKNHTRMLIYRGTREWCRLYESALMLGVYTPDELDDLGNTDRSIRARDVTPQKPTVGGHLRLRPADDEAPEGFTHAGIEMETATLRDAAENKAEVGVPELSAEERKNLSLLIRQCKAASTKTSDQSKLDPKVVVDVAKGFDATGNLSTKFARDKAGTITRSFKSVCEGKTSLEAAVQYTCGLVGIEPSELDEVK